MIWDFSCYSRFKRKISTISLIKLTQFSITAIFLVWILSVIYKSKYLSLKSTVNSFITDKFLNIHSSNNHTFYKIFTSCEKFNDKQIILKNCIFTKCYSNTGPSCIDTISQRLSVDSLLIINNCKFNFCFSMKEGGIAKVAPNSCILENLCCVGCKSMTRGHTFFAWIGENITFTNCGMDKCGPKQVPGESELMMLYGGNQTFEKNNISRCFSNELRALGVFRPSGYLFYAFNENINSSGKSLLAFYLNLNFPSNISFSFIIRCNTNQKFQPAAFEFTHYLVIANFSLIGTNDIFSSYTLLSISYDSFATFMDCYTDLNASDIPENEDNYYYRVNHIIYNYSFSSRPSMLICKANPPEATKIKNITRTRTIVGAADHGKFRFKDPADENIEFESLNHTKFPIVLEIILIILVFVMVIVLIASAFYRFRSLTSTKQDFNNILSNLPNA